MNKDFYINNRCKYFNSIQDNSITILSSGVTFNKSADMSFPFSVNRNFYYLCGINQENVILVLEKNNNISKSILFIEENDPILVKWVGYKLEIDQAKLISGVDEVYYISELDNYLEQSVNNFKTAYLDLSKNKNYYSYCLDFSNKLIEKYQLNYCDCYKTIVGLRFIKEEEEINKIKESIEATKIGIETLMQKCCSGMYEYQLESYFDFCIKNNLQRETSFTTIAASGANATILHYENNNSILKDGDLVLFDLGCQTDFYISDISRTFPVNGKFNLRQKEVYNEVLWVNKECIKFLKPNITRVEFNDYAKKLLTESCYRLGLIEKDEDVVNYYYHSIGHSIGLDTHDPANYEEGIKDGCVMTVEPGLYIASEGIGIRIEDNILVRSEGNINLSASIIKEVDEIEDYFQKFNKNIKRVNK